MNYSSSHLAKPLAASQELLIVYPKRSSLLLVSGAIIVGACKPSRALNVEQRFKVSTRKDEGYQTLPERLLFWIEGDNDTRTTFGHWPPCGIGSAQGFELSRSRNSEIGLKVREKVRLHAV